MRSFAAVDFAAAERAGEPEIADRLRQNEFRAKMVEEIQWRQLTGGAGPTGMGGEQVALPFPLARLVLEPIET